MAKAATPAADKAANSTQAPQTEGAAPNTQAGDNPAGDTQMGDNQAGNSADAVQAGADPKAARIATIKRNAARFASEMSAATGEAVSADAVEKHFRRLADEFGIDAAEVYATNRDGTAIVTVAGQKLPVAE